MNRKSQTGRTQSPTTAPVVATPKQSGDAELKENQLNQVSGGIIAVLRQQG
jgi:hypothetical protein